MRKHVAGWGLILTAAFFPGLSLVADDVPVSKDLMTVIALQGLSCGKVVGVKRQGHNDYIASCENGNRYRVFINGAGRVVAQKQ